MRKPHLKLGAAALAALTAVGAAPIATASSHSEAPLTAQSPITDDTDFYMFVDPNDPTKVVLIANRFGLIEPQGGPNYAGFLPGAYYDINVDNDGDAVADVVYRFTFAQTVARPDTFIYADGPVTSIDSASLNVKQTYSLAKRTRNGDGTYTSTTLLSNQPVLPPNIGTKTFPSGYRNLQNGIQTAQNGNVRVLVGPRQDPFFVDLGMTFDLVNLEVPGAPVASPGRPGVGVGATGGGRDTLYGYTVLTTTLSVPAADLVKGGVRITDSSNLNAIIGAWSSISVPKTKTFNADGSVTYSGEYQQVSRLGNPLVNEVLVGLGKKDAWNASTPAQESAFKASELRPILATYMNVLFGVNTPPNTSDRGDIELALFRGIPAGNSFGVPPTQRTGEVYSDLLRLNTAVAPTPFASASRLGYLGGDVAGFPNGRRPCDDVVDIELRVVAGVLLGAPYAGAPNNLLGDGVDVPQRGCRYDFPFMWSPTGGFDALHAGAPAGTHAAQVRGAAARVTAPERGFVRGSEDEEFEPLTHTSSASY